MKMKKPLKRIVNFFNNSGYVKPLSVFALVFIATCAVVFILEYKRNDQFQTFTDSLWWGIITFSTTGYGDKVPESTGGRILAIVTIFIGIAGMSFLSGTFASVFVERNTRARRGLMDFPKMKDHFIICGWKNHMKDILLDIIHVAGNITADIIIIISNVDSDKIEELKEEQELKDINFVRGDYFSEATLNRANVTYARKVLILADTFESAAVSEVDSKSVMTVLTIKAMSKNVYTAVELLDKKYENYLKQALCDEILFSRDFSRQMIANTTAINGMSHIIYDLLSQTNSRLSTCGIPEEFLGKTFEQYKDAFSAFRNTILIGILENTGSSNMIKMEALREAQKTSDVSRLVTNLQKVKEMEMNRPVLVPPLDYVIQKHSQAIILERSEA